MVLVTALLAALLAGCGGPATTDVAGRPLPAAAGSPTGAPSAPATSVAGASDLVGIYPQVLFHYLASPDNSFGPRAFRLVYVLDTARPDAADPMSDGTGTPVAISKTDQSLITDELSGVATVRFIADRDSVLETRDGCTQVRDGGILIVLAPPVGDDAKVTVGIHGFVACLGATWFTYVVENDLGEWRVTGKTGPAAIA